MFFRKTPYFFEDSNVPKLLSKLAPIEISAITLGPFVFSREKLSEKTKRHETIHFMQYKETFYIGFLFIYLFDFLWAALIKRKGFSRESYLSIRFEQEAWHCDDYDDYASARNKFAWLHYPLGGEEK
jgi:hypothetical protein